MDQMTYVATNQHVAVCAKQGASQELFILLSRNDGVRARIVWSDADTDLAIISAEGTLRRPAVTLAETSSLTPGAAVTVVGFPAAADKLVPTNEIAAPSLTRGYISRVMTGRNGVRYFEHTAVTIPGSSGGPVYSEEGAVIGVVSINALAVINSITDGQFSVTQVNTGLGAAVDVAELLPHLQENGVPYVIARTVTPMSVSLIILIIALFLLLSAGAVILATPSGRAMLAGDRTRIIAGGGYSGARAGKIRILGGSLAGTELPILDRVILGRDPARAHVVFPEADTAVSRRHCEIVFDSAAAEFQVCDLGSRNGTFVVSDDGTSLKLSPNVSERVMAGHKLLVGSPKNTLLLELA